MLLTGPSIFIELKPVEMYAGIIEISFVLSIYIRHFLAFITESD